MHYQRIFLLLFAIISLPVRADVTPDAIQLAVWANEAIVTTYTYNAQTFLERQKEIAFYFTGTGWMAYSKALVDSKLPDTIKKNNYDVSAVATMPPIIKEIHPHYWQAVMPLLVVYKNPQHLQKQTLNITLDFTIAPSGQGIRGLAITSLQAKVMTPACQCTAEAHPTSDTNSKDAATIVK